MFFSCVIILSGSLVKRAQSVRTMTAREVGDMAMMFRQMVVDIGVSLACTNRDGDTGSPVCKLSNEGSIRV